MKHTFVATLAVISIGLVGTSRAQSLTSLGDTVFNVEDGVTTAGYSQTDSALTLNSGFSLGSTLGGLFNSSFDWSGVVEFGLNAFVTGTNPQAAFSIEFYDSSVLTEPETAIIARFSGASSDAGSSATIVTLTLEELLNGNFNDVVGLQFTWDTPAPGGSGSMTINSIEAVPEPSTWALIGLAAAIFGGRVLAKRRR